MMIDHNGIFLCKFGNIMWNVFTAIKVCNTHLNTMKVRDKLLNNRFEYPNDNKKRRFASSLIFRKV